MSELPKAEAATADQATEIQRETPMGRNPRGPRQKRKRRRGLSAWVRESKTQQKALSATFRFMHVNCVL